MIIQICCINCREEFSVMVRNTYPHRNPTFTNCGECGRILPLCGEDLFDYI